MIIQLCSEHEELAGTTPIDTIRNLWTWQECTCRIILDRD